MSGAPAQQEVPGYLCGPATEDERLAYLRGLEFGYRRSAMIAAQGNDAVAPRDICDLVVRLLREAEEIGLDRPRKIVEGGAL